MRGELAWLIDAAATAVDRERAAALAIPIVDTAPASGFLLARDTESLALHRLAGPRTYPLRCDLAAYVAQRGGSGLRQSPLVRACGVSPAQELRIIDATAGLARDTVTLAAAGGHVQAVERQPALSALLADAVETIGEWPESAWPAWFSRLSRPVHADAVDWLGAGDAVPADVIYLDPMFASPRRKAQPQKALAWLAELAGSDPDAAELLAIARTRAAHRVVVKQHARARPLAPPSHQIQGRAVRFDVYMTG